MFQNKNSASVKANSLFEGLDKNFRINISQKDFVEKKEGEIIYQNGDNADFIYLILEGEVKQKISGVFTTPVIVKSNQNEFFGEKEVLENNKRSSSAVANTDCLLYRMEKSVINNLAEQNKTIKRNLYKSLLMDEPDENMQAEPQKKFFINAEDSTQKFKIPEEKTPENKDRIEITHEDIAEIEMPEPLPENEEAQVPAEEEMPLAEEPLADEISAENYINFDKETAEEFMASQNADDSPNLDDDITSEQQEITTEQNWNFAHPEEIEDEKNNPEVPLPGFEMPLDNETKMTEEPAEVFDNAEVKTAEEPILAWKEEQPPVEENITDKEIIFPEEINTTGEDVAAEDVSIEPAPGASILEPEPQIPEGIEKKLNSGKEVAGLISNDLLYPVSTVKFYADQIKKRKISPELNEVVELLLEQATIIQDLADVVYDFTEERSSLNTEPSNINDILDEVLGLLADFIESRSSRLYKKFGQNMLVDLDKRKFYQAMFQIAKITCNTIPAGGNIYVVSTSEADYVRIYISTISSPKTDKSSAGEFSPLLTSGLGYVLAERIIRDHGGNILIEKTEEGSKLIISLPVLK